MSTIYCNHEDIISLDDNNLAVNESGCYHREVSNTCNAIFTGYCRITFNKGNVYCYNEDAITLDSKDVAINDNGYSNRNVSNTYRKNFTGYYRIK